MGLYDKSKKGLEMEHTPLFNAIERIKEDSSYAAQVELSKVLKNYVDNSVWVPFPMKQDDIGYQMHIWIELYLKTLKH